jgi:hypothetical protein
MQNSTAFRKVLIAMWHDKLLLAYQESGMYRWQVNVHVQLPLRTPPLDDFPGEC